MIPIILILLYPTNSTYARPLAGFPNDLYAVLDSIHDDVHATRHAASVDDDL